MRHGRPLFDHRGWISASQMPEWIVRYNEAAVEDPTDRDARSGVGLPAAAEGEAYAAALAQARQAGRIVASTLPRSQQSARLLAAGREVYYGRQFREADMPYRGLPLITLPYRTWCAVFRLAWLFGFSAHAESRAEAEARAQRAARRLVEMARERGSVLLVGHGIMNRLIAKQLRISGAAGPTHVSRGYWSFDVFEIAR